MRGQNVMNLRNKNKLLLLSFFFFFSSAVKFVAFAFFLTPDRMMCPEFTPKISRSSCSFFAVAVLLGLPKG